MTFQRPGWGSLLEAATEVHGPEWADQLMIAIAACDQAQWNWWDTWLAGAQLVASRAGDPEALRRRAQQGKKPGGLPPEIAGAHPQPPEVAARGASLAKQLIGERLAALTATPDAGDADGADDTGGAA